MLAYPAMTRLSRATLRWPLQTDARRVPSSRPATDGRCSWGRNVATVERMTIQRMEHVGIVVDDLAAATAFFFELGLKLQGDGPVEGGWTAWWARGRPGGDRDGGDSGRLRPRPGGDHRQWSPRG